MLTIKHVEDQCETLMQVHQIAYWPHGKEGKESIRKNASMLEAFGCTINDDGGATKDGYTCFDTGTVYVMNDTGSTVGVYRL